MTVHKQVKINKIYYILYISKIASSMKAVVAFCPFPMVNGICTNNFEK